MSDYVYVKVALPLPIFDEFTYSIPKSLYDKLVDKNLIGYRALVPFGKGNTGYTGIITDVFQSDNPLLAFEVKDVEDIPDNFPVFTEKHIKVAEKLSEYYVSPLGMILNLFIPSALRWKKKEGKWVISYYENKIYSVNPNITVKKLTKQQKKLIELLLEVGSLSQEELVELGFSVRTVKALEKKGVLKAESLNLTTNGVFLNKPKLEKTITKEELPLKGVSFLNFKKAEERLEFYEKLIASLQNQSGLFVFPNVESLKAVFEALSKRFPNVFVYFEGLNPKENVKTFKSLQKNTGILLTTYSGLMMPIKNLAFVVVEEEQSTTYKLLRSPKIDVRRAAFELHRFFKVPIIYSSYIPSVEGYYLLKQGLGKSLNSKQNITSKASVRVLSFSKEKGLKNLLLNQIERKTLILANKKAYASYLYCPRCDEELLCPSCDVPLRIYKKGEFYLKCEACRQTYTFIENCPKCETKLVQFGFGIDKVYEILKEAGFDVSYLNDKKDTQIKLTTTIVDKEFSVGKFDTVINLFPDFYLYMPDYKGREKFFKNLVYPYLKAKNRYILFTNNEDEISVKALLQKNPKLFYKDELGRRKKAKLPPFSKLILLTFEKKDLDVDFLRQLFEIWIQANNIQDFDYTGVLNAQISTVRGKKRAQVLLRDFKERNLLKDLYKKAQKLGIRMIIDVDPVNLL